MGVDRNGLRILERDECLRRLGRATIGRVGVTSRALPLVLPVNFLLDGDQILIRTAPGTKLSAALADAVVCFEVDHVDPTYHSGWSVVVTGTSHVVDDAEELDRLDNVPLAHWGPRDGYLVSISTEIVTGRELPGPSPAPTM